VGSACDFESVVFSVHTRLAFTESICSPGQQESSSRLCVFWSLYVDSHVIVTLDCAICQS
jgi:hypothetical protein